MKPKEYTKSIYQLLIDSIENRNGKIYVYGVPIVNRKKEELLVDADSFKPISDCYFLDNNDIYALHLIIKSASTKIYFSKLIHPDRESFQPISRYFAKDKNSYYYLNKKIKESYLELFDDQTYKLDIGIKKSKEDGHALWCSRVAISKDTIYWQGIEKKEVDVSLKKITPYLYADKNNVYSYNLQNIKKIAGVDRKSLVYFNVLKNNSIYGYATDKHKPISCYVNKSEISQKYDYKKYTSFFKKNRDKLSQEYWWYKMEKTIYG